MGLFDFVKSLKQKNVVETQKELDFKNMTLMYENQPVVDVEMAERGIGKIVDIRNGKLFPIGVKKSEIISLKDSFNIWLEYKTIPQGRPNINECLQKLNMKTPYELSCKSFYLSFNDSFWFKPKNANIQWEDINLFDNSFSSDIGDILFNPNTNKITINYISPDSTTNGLDAKRWLIENRTAYLLKTNYNIEQMAYNEVFAMEIAKKLQLPVAEYSIVKGSIVINEQEIPCTFSKSKNFCNKGDIVLPFGYLRTLTQNNTKKLIDFIKEKYPVAYNNFKKMLILDFIIANEDRHNDNMSIRIDQNGEWHFGTMYDNGNSMYFEDKTLNGIGNDVKCKFSGHLSNKEIMLQHINYDDLTFINKEFMEDVVKILKNTYSESEMPEERIEALEKSTRGKIDSLIQYKEQLFQRFNELEETR